MNIRITRYFYDVEHDYGNTVSEGRIEFKLFASREDAGEAAREYWADMAESDPKEFTCMVGEDTLIAWGLGKYAGPGSTRVKSLGEWLDLWLDTPEEHFASYDGEEREVSGPTDDERLRAVLITRLREAFEAGGYITTLGCGGIKVGEEIYWLVASGAGEHGGRFVRGDAVPSVEGVGRDDVKEALEEDETPEFVEAWENLVDELGFTPTVAYRSN